MPLKVWIPLFLILVALGAWAIATMLQPPPVKCEAGLVCIGAPL